MAISTEKSVQIQKQQITERPDTDPILPKSETNDAALQRPSRDFKRTQRVNRIFSLTNNKNVNDAKSLSAPLKEKPKKIAFRPASDYDYYDDGDIGIIGKSNSKVKTFTNGIERAPILHATFLFV